MAASKKTLEVNYTLEWDERNGNEGARLNVLIRIAYGKQTAVASWSPLEGLGVSPDAPVLSEFRDELANECMFFWLLHYLPQDMVVKAALGAPASERAENVDKGDG